MSFRKAWSRLSQLSWDEFRTRAGQETSKRADLARYRLGLGFGNSAGAITPPGAPKTPLSSVPFFFNPDEIPHRIQLLRQHLPQEVECIRAEADAICRHQFDLLGYTNLPYGAEIDWHFDAVHGKRAPLKPWFKINFLDFSEVGDHKVIWELNRHQHLVTLAKAWWLTKDLSYIRELEAQWHSWQQANPYPLGINWASTLEVAFRSLSWLWVRHLLLDCSEFQPRTRTGLVAALRFNGRYIERYLSKYFSPNTHLLGEAVALLAIATLLPDLPESERWKKVSWQIVVEESRRQVRPDGVYFEQTLYYHVYALDFFLYARMLAARSGIATPSEFDDVLGKMLDVVAALARGRLEGFGDDDGGRVFDPRRNRVEHMSDPLAIGAIEYRNPEWTRAAKLTEESIWLFGDRALSLLETETSTRTLHSKAFEAGGIYLMWDYDPVPQQMMIDAGPQGAGNSGHGHADALSIRYSMNSHRVLVDPGTCCYVSAGNERAAFRGTAAHNTLRVDETDQAIPAGPFAWTSIPAVSVTQWHAGETFELFEGSHDGYRRLLDPVVHQRSVFHLRGAFWLIRDIVDGKQTHLLETFWHFGPKVQVQRQQDALIASFSAQESTSVIDSDASGNDTVALLLPQASSWLIEISTGQISPAYGVTQPAPVVRISAKVQLPTESAVLLVPFAAGISPGEFAEITGTAKGSTAYRYTVGKNAHHFFFSDESPPWLCGDWSSDARMLYCRVDDGRLEQIVMVGGSYVKWREKALVTHRALVEQFELIKIQGRFKAISSQPAMLDQAVDGMFEHLDMVVDSSPSTAKT